MLRKITSLLLPPQRFISKERRCLFLHTAVPKWRISDVKEMQSPISSWNLSTVAFKAEEIVESCMLRLSSTSSARQRGIIFPLICAGQTEAQRFSYEFNVVYIPCNSAQGRNVPREEEGGRGNKRNFPAGKQKEAIIKMSKSRCCHFSSQALDIGDFFNPGCYLAAWDIMYAGFEFDTLHV